MLLHDFEDYFDLNKAGAAYQDANEALADGMIFLELILEAYVSEVVYRGSLMPDEDDFGLLDRFGRTDGELSEWFAAMPEDRGAIYAGDEVKSAVAKAGGYIRARGEETVRAESVDGDKNGNAIYTKMPLAMLCIAFELDVADVFALLLALSVHLDEKYVNFCRRLVGGDYPTVGLCERIITYLDGGEEEDDGLSGAAKLFCRRRSVAGQLFDTSGKLYTWFLAKRSTASVNLLPKVEEPLVLLSYVRRLLCGEDKGLSLMPDGLELVRADEEEPVFFPEMTEAIAGAQPGIYYIKGFDRADAIHVLKAAAKQKESWCYVSDLRELPNSAGGMQAFYLRLKLYPGFLFLHTGEGADDGQRNAASGQGADRDVLLTVLDELKRREIACTVFVFGEDALPGRKEKQFSFAGAKPGLLPGVLHLGIPGIKERIAIWTYFLVKEGLVLAEDLDLLDIADCHENTYGQIRHVARQAKATLALASREGEADENAKYVLGRALLQELLFSLLASNLDALATPIPAQYTWEDIYLEEGTKARLRAACDRFRLRHRLGADWGLNRKNAYGNAVIVLMYGAPGTGKTMAAQAIANEVMTPLYRVDVSQIFSKYIGETQKNLSKIFDEAAKRSVVLFFDEADALFTRRTEIRDSHDKYANSDTSFLLQKIEEYNGISILATNNYQSFDPAFMRRLTYVAHFERPDTATRLKMWKSMLPEEVPMGADVDFAFLAENFEEMSGSNIKSILYTAAYFAGAKKQPIVMADIIRAIVYEHEKLGRLVDSSMFGAYAMYLEGLV